MDERLEQVEVGSVVQHVKGGLLVAISVALPVAANHMVGLLGAMVAVALFSGAVWLFRTRGVVDEPLPGRVTSRSDWLQIVAGLMILGLSASVLID